MKRFSILGMALIAVLIAACNNDATPAAPAETPAAATIGAEQAGSSEETAAPAGPVLFEGSIVVDGRVVPVRSAQLSLPAVAWRRLNSLWVANFVVVGALNLYVAYRFSEAAWVSYKLYSAIGFTLLPALGPNTPRPLITASSRSAAR